MKISVASDIHLEFDYMDLENVDQTDVLILAGDIMVADEIKRYPFDNSIPINGSKVQERALIYQRFFREVSERWKHVFYVSGNHENYEGVFNKTDTIIRGNLSHIGDNIHYLQDECYVLDGVVFMGSTLWTDLNKQDSLTAFHLSQRMNDYERIRCYGLSGSEGAYRKLKPQDTLLCHYKSTQYFKFIASEKRDQKIVVITHHAPTYVSMSPHYKSDFLMNGGYASELSDIIMDNENIALWIHGHTHSPFDYMVGDTRVVCNPRGYLKYDQNAIDFKVKTIEV